MTEVKLLTLMETEHDSVRFLRSSNICDKEWSRFLNYWCNSADNFGIGSKFIELPFVSFIKNIEALRFGWTSLGSHYKVHISEKLKVAIKNSQSVKLEVERIVNQEHKIQKIDFKKIRLKRSLTPFQEWNISHLISVRSGANFSVPGAGKTSTTLVLWQLLFLENRVGKLLVIAPRSAFEAWKKEPGEVFEKTFNTCIFNGKHIPPETDILVTNYEQLESSHKLQRLKNWVVTNHAMIVLDEAHRVKGGGQSVRWRACSELTPLASRVDLLSGTPMPQGYDDLRNLFSLSWPEVPANYFSDDKLNNMPTGSIFVRTTKDELELPPVDINLISIPMAPIQSQIYSALRKSYAGTFKLSDGQSAYFGAKGRAVMTLIAAATNPGLMLGLAKESAFMGFSWPPKNTNLSEDLIDVVEKYSNHEMPSKYEWVSKYCKKACNEGRKILIWSHFIGNLKALTKILAPMNPVIIYGATSNDERELLLEKFRSDSSCSVLLSNPQTLGEGVSLHRECHECIYIDRLYNAGLYLQSLDRIHRLGLAKKQITKVFVLQSSQSIDLRVGHRLETKIVRLSNALNDRGLVKNSIPDFLESTPDELVGLDELDINDLFSHLNYA